MEILSPETLELLRWEEDSPLVVPSPPVTKKRAKQQKATEKQKADPKYIKYREKNTKKAKECRDRKRENRRVLSLRLKEALAKNEELQKKVKYLEEEISILEDTFM
jgi:hypothetical protein